MPAPQWTDEMSVGVARLDDDHKKLLGLLNDLHDVLRRHEAETVVGATLGELIRYTYYHFGEEERQLEAAGYADLAAHRQSHRSIAEQVRAMEAKYDADHTSVIAAELFKFLSDWLIHHIKTEDMRYRPALTRP